MRNMERRLSALEHQSRGRKIDLDHIPLADLEEMERILAKPMLDFTADDVRLFQKYGFMARIIPGPGLLRDWFDPDDIALLEANQ